MRAYKNFLNGKRKENEYFANVSYDEAIIDIGDFIIDTLVTEFNDKDKKNTLKCDKQEKSNGHKRDDNEPNHERISVKKGKLAPIPVDAIDASEKCWTFKIPFLAEQNIMTVVMRMKKSIFPEKNRIARKGFKVIISYPGQTLRVRVMKYKWKGITGSFAMVFNIQNMVVLKRRNKSNQPCHRNGTLDDIRLRDSFIRSLGCRPTFMTSPSVFPQCSAGKNLKNCDGSEWDEGHVEPCKQVEKIFYTYEEYDNLHSYGKEAYFYLQFNFQGKTYMEIEQTRDYDLQSLIGNAGGYVGLFLGVCLMQLPQLLFDGYNCVKTIRHNV